MTISVQDKMWFIWYDLAVLAEVVGINDYFRKQHPDGFLFYDLDEPIGHDLGESELYNSLDDLLQQNNLQILNYNEKDCAELHTPKP